MADGWSDPGRGMKLAKVWSAPSCSGASPGSCLMQQRRDKNGTTVTISITERGKFEITLNQRGKALDASGNHLVSIGKTIFTVELISVEMPDGARVSFTLQRDDTGRAAHAFARAQQIDIEGALVARLEMPDLALEELKATAKANGLDLNAFAY